MSSSSLESIELIEVVNEATHTLELFVAATALFCFDYCLTFTREIQRIWKLKLAPSAIIFYCVRYPALFSTLFVILEQTRWSGISDPSCSVLVHCQMALNIVLLASATAFSALRAYALSGQNRRILAVVLFLGSVNPLVSLYTFVESEVYYIDYPYQACGFSPTITPAEFKRWIIGARASTVLTDTIVLVITISKTRALRTEAAAISFVSTVADILARDGTLYFVVLLLANLVGLSLVKSFELIQPMSTWIAILTAIMTSRFILDLHEAADPRAGHDACHADLRAGTLSMTMLFPGSAPGSFHARTPSISMVFGTSTYASDWPGVRDEPMDECKDIGRGSEWTNQEQMLQSPEMSGYGAEVHLAERVGGSHRRPQGIESVIWIR